MPLAQPTLPYLQYFPSQSGLIRRIPVAPVPFIIGRDNSSNFVVPSSKVSKRHAEVARVGSTFQIRDLCSTNGTFVDGRPISTHPLENNAIVHLAHEEFRFVSVPDEVEVIPETPCTERVDRKVPPSIILGTIHLKELLRRRNFRILFQPIVSLDTGLPLGYEALARGTHSDLSIKPTDLFLLADRCGMAESLSQMFRRAALEESCRLAGPGHIFLNVHPSEINSPMFLESLAQMQSPDRQIVLEIHEDAMADLPTWQKIRLHIHKLGLQLAYDDFGAGQARLMELAEMPPEFLKLDMKLVRDIHLIKSRQQLIQALTHVSTELGVEVIAEGVESSEEENVCRSLGCGFGQGFFFAQPQAAGTFRPISRQARRFAADLL